MNKQNIQIAFMGPSFEESLPIIKECIGSINAMIRKQDGNDALKAIPHNSPKGICLMYKKTSPSDLFSEIVIEDGDDWKDKITLFQDFVFNACKAYGFFETIKMRGDATEGDEAAFDVVTGKKKKTYVLWEKPTVENTVERFLEFLTTYEIIRRNPTKAASESLFATFSCPRGYAGAYRTILVSFGFRGEQFRDIIPLKSKVSDTYGKFDTADLNFMNVSLDKGDISVTKDKIWVMFDGFDDHSKDPEVIGRLFKKVRETWKVLEKGSYRKHDNVPVIK